MSRAGVMSALCVLACLGVAAAEQGRISPVQKVITMIDDFSAKVAKDLKQAGLEFEEVAKFCDDESTAKDYAIKKTNEEIETLHAAIEQGKAQVVEYESNIQAASGAISSAEEDIHKGTAARAKQHETFLASEKSLLDNINQLNTASKTLAEQGASLAQLTPAAQQGLDAVVGGLSDIVEASFVSSAQRQKVKAFIQARTEAQGELTLQSQSQGVVAVIDGLIERAEGTLSDVRKKEMDTTHEFSMLKNALELQIKNSQAELAQNTHGKQVAVEALSESEKSLAATEKSLATDTEYLADFKRECQDKARGWEAESKDGDAELKALAAAKEILVKKFNAVFVQSSAKLTRSSVRTNDDDSKARALRIIEQLGQKFHSTALVSLAYKASADPFGKIRGMVEDMIAKLQKEAAAEATQKAFCDEEMSKSLASKSEKEEKLDKIDARIEKGEAAVAVLSEQIATLSQEIAEIDTAVKEATEIRTKESSIFAAREKDFKESEEACASAIEVLREYYEGVALTQLSTVVSRGTSQSKDSSGIIALLEVAESDFAKLLADCRSEESAAVSEFKKLTEDSKISKATKDAQRKGKESEVKSLKGALADSGSDKEGLSAELEAVLHYLSELQPQCETKAPSYAEIKAKREQEIAGLKEALDVLSEDVALVQRSPGHLRRRA